MQPACLFLGREQISLVSSRSCRPSPDSIRPRDFHVGGFSNSKTLHRPKAARRRMFRLAGQAKRAGAAVGLEAGHRPFGVLAFADLGAFAGSIRRFSGRQIHRKRACVIGLSAVRYALFLRRLRAKRAKPVAMPSGTGRSDRG
jgi:hypothetical protein